MVQKVKDILLVVLGVSVVVMLLAGFSGQERRSMKTRMVPSDAQAQSVVLKTLQMEVESGWHIEAVIPSGSDNVTLIMTK